MKKHLPILILSLLLCLLLAACGSNAAPAVSPAAPQQPAAPSVTATPEPTATPAPAFTLRITELMAANSGYITDGCNAFPDWVEVYNYGTEPVLLNGAVLQSTAGEDVITAGTVNPGGYLVIWCGSSSAENRCGIKLARDGDTVTLLAPWGTEQDSVSYTACPKNTALCFEGGTATESLWPTPGYENSDAGYAAFCAARVSSGIAINEAVAYNGTLQDAGGETPDWVELKNYGTEPCSLAGLYLSDDTANPQCYPLPEVTLAPGELYVLFLSDAVTGFELSNSGDKLFLSDGDGRLLDSMLLRDLSYAGSLGRDGNGGAFAYFAVPSPGEDNTGGCYQRTTEPTADVPQGVYDGITGLTVTLSSDGPIHYTLDGSTPTADSPLYTAPLLLAGTTVVRAATIEDGKLTGDTLDLTYVINEGHSLPVTSLVIDPEDMFSSGRGLYKNPTEDWERAGSVSFFDGEDSFSIACGIKLHGATSKLAQSKKSMKLCFRGRYEGALNYDVFGNGVTEFSSLLLRAAQESTLSSHIRDVVMHDLASQCTGALPVQDTRFTVLYINGEYWGLYAIRESHSAQHYAAHFGVEKDSVTMTHESWSADPNATEICNFILNNSMRDADNYAQIADRIDVENIAAWCLMQTYSGNLDIYPPNVRWYYSTQDGVFRYALVDLDLGLFVFGNFTTPLYTGYVYSDIIARLTKNETFRDEFLRCWGEWLSGPMSDENVNATVHRWADLIDPEIARDAARWHYTKTGWENEITNYLDNLTAESSRHAYYTARSARSYYGLDEEQYAYYFGNVK